MYKYTVVVPVFNSEGSLHELVSRIERTMDKYGNYEMIFIDDLSTDNSWHVLKELKKDRSNMRALRFSNNFGQAAATLCGIGEANSEIIITIDDDLQYPPEEITQLIRAFNPLNEYIVFGVPKIKEHNAFKRLGSLLMKFIIQKSILNSDFKHVDFSTFKIFSKKLYKPEKYNESNMKSDKVFFELVSSRLMKSILVEHQKRTHGKTKYNYKKTFKIFLDTFLVLPRLINKWFIIGILFFVIASVLLITLQPTTKMMIYLMASGFTITLMVLFFILLYVQKLYSQRIGITNFVVWQEA
ncbi:MAG: glycosyltransferase [Bacteroidia bacterium]